LTADLLTALGNLKDLLYLKLVADKLEEITFRDRALPNLLCLCFVVKHPTFPKVEDGALPHLVSLQLLCENLDDQCIVQIKGFTRLREVVLYDELNTDVKANWVQAVKEHQNKPKVLLLKRLIHPKGQLKMRLQNVLLCQRDKYKKQESKCHQKSRNLLPTTRDSQWLVLL